MSDAREADAPSDPPPLMQTAEKLGHAGKESVSAAWELLGAFRRLFAADLALSRSAFGLTLAWAGVAIALGASAWLLLMAWVVVLLHEAAGLSWSGAVAVPAQVSLLGAAGAAWWASRVFDDTRLNATRRQLARFGLGEDPADVEREPERVA